MEQAPLAAALAGAVAWVVDAARAAAWDWARRAIVCVLIVAIRFRIRQVRRVSP